jgi:hypothetical protein
VLAEGHVFSIGAHREREALDGGNAPGQRRRRNAPRIRCARLRAFPKPRQGCVGDRVSHRRRPGRVDASGRACGNPPQAFFGQFRAQRNVHHRRVVGVHANALVAHAHHQPVARRQTQHFGVARHAVHHHERHFGVRVDREVKPQRHRGVWVRRLVRTLQEPELLAKTLDTAAELFGIHPQQRQPQGIRDACAVGITNPVLGKGERAGGRGQRTVSVFARLR